MATEPYGSSNQTVPRSPEEVTRMELTRAFYETYDVMTGVRIAATLGGFFALMVLLVLVKSKSKTEKALEDPDFTAAAVAEVEEEEERQLAAVLELEASAYQQLNPRRSSRKSLEAGWTRFSSIGGYSSLMEPPTRSRLPSFIDEDTPPEEDAYGHLDVPRRPSNITCSSSGSSYLERRDSAVVLGIPAHKSSNQDRRRSSPLLEIYDLYYPIDIKVIQPTPGGSPCGSERALDEAPPKTRLAPLASISSCNSSLGGADLTELDDSVFGGGESTDDEVDQFSTDSEMGGRGSLVVTPTNQPIGKSPTQETLF